MDKIVDFINVNRDRYIDEMKRYLAIPSISALPEHKGDVRTCAEWTADEMRRIGLQNVRLEETPGHPVVYGEWLGAPGAPTILFYGHYDVQPVDPVNLWTSPPFEATIRDGEIYARGSADDKGQVFMHFKAIEAHLKQTGSLPVNMKILIEGEEEVGSANLDNFINAHKDLLKADVVVISDSPMFDRGIPSICYGLRGLTYFQIDLRGSKSDLHSGSFGGAVANPAMVLAQVLAQMKDKSGRIKIDGFYDDVVALRPEERAEWAQAAVQREEVQAGAGRAEAVRRNRLHHARAGVGEADVRGQRPAVGIHRRWRQDRAAGRGDGEGEHAAGAEPGPEEDRRPVRGRTSRRSTPKTVELKITRMHGGKPWMTDFDNKFVQAAGRAIEQGFGQRPVFNREGGSIPVVSTFQEELGVPCVLFGVGLPDENAHAPDEKLDLGNFHNGVIASAYLYREIGQLR